MTRPANSSPLSLRRAPARGFTLIEILVALAVLAIALAALVKGAGAFASNTAHLRDRALAEWLAQNKIIELQLSGSWPPTGRSDGTSLFAARDWHWRLDVNDTPDQDVRRLNLEIRAGDRNADTLAALTAYMGRPQ